MSKEIEFKHIAGDDFSAYTAAEKWLRANGYSVGSMQLGSPTAAFLGDCDVSKWRNLSGKERASVDAMILCGSDGRFREQDLIVNILASPAPTEEKGTHEQD